MSGYWPLSRTQQFDLNGDLMNGEETPAAQVQFFVGATSTPMITYQDAGLALVHPAVIPVDSQGRFPGVFFDDVTYSFYRQRVTDTDGALIFDDATVPIIGQVAGGGGSDVPVDLNSTFTTGDVKFSRKTGAIGGWVRLNGRTVGSATSGATERANSDTQSLFEFLWPDTTLTVSGGRGANAAADWAANKTITLDDGRRAVIAALSDMGNSELAGIAGGTTVGRSAVGEESHALIEAELAAHTHADGTLAAANHGHPARISNVGSSGSLSTGGFMLDTGGDANYAAFTGTPTATAGQQIGGSGAVDVSGATSSSGSGTAHNNMPPFMRFTVYMRL